MRPAKVFPAVIMLIILLSSPSSAIEPFAANEGGFGPKIAGTQLGVKMTLMEIIRWRINLRGLPFTLEINSERIPGRTPLGAGSISILFKGKGKELSDFEVSSASREFYRYRQEKMRLQDLIGELENAYIETITLRGKNTRVREDCITFTEDMRVASIKIRRNDWGGGGMMSHETCVRELTRIYGLPEMRRRGHAWGFRNEAEGWQVIYHGFGDGILAVDPVIE